MEIGDAVSVTSTDRSLLFDYAHRTFAEVEQLIRGLDVRQLQQPRQSILPQIQVSSTGQLYFSGERNIAVLDDLLFHISHTGRHLGMIEALRGVMFAIAGTASV